MKLQKKRKTTRKKKKAKIIIATLLVGLVLFGATVKAKAEQAYVPPNVKVVIAIDTSGSMMNTLNTSGPTVVNSAVTFIRLLEKIPNTSVAFVLFSNSYKTGSDKAALKYDGDKAVEKYTFSSLSSNAKDIYKALQEYQPTEKRNRFSYILGGLEQVEEIIESDKSINNNNNDIYKVVLITDFTTDEKIKGIIKKGKDIEKNNVGFFILQAIHKDTNNMDTNAFKNNLVGDCNKLYSFTTLQDLDKRYFDIFSYILLEDLKYQKDELPYKTKPKLDNGSEVKGKYNEEYPFSIPVYLNNMSIRHAILVAKSSELGDIKEARLCVSKVESYAENVQGLPYVLFAVGEETIDNRLVSFVKSEEANMGKTPFAVELDYEMNKSDESEDIEEEKNDGLEDALEEKDIVCGDDKDKGSDVSKKDEFVKQMMQDRPKLYLFKKTTPYIRMVIEPSNKPAFKISSQHCNESLALPMSIDMTFELIDKEETYIAKANDTIKYEIKLNDEEKKEATFNDKKKPILTFLDIKLAASQADKQSTVKFYASNSDISVQTPTFIITPPAGPIVDETKMKKGENKLCKDENEKYVIQLNFTGKRKIKLDLNTCFLSALRKDIIFSVKASNTNKYKIKVKGNTLEISKKFSYTDKNNLKKDKFTLIAKDDYGEQKVEITCLERE